MDGLDQAIKEDWQENLRAVQQEVALDFEKFQQQYQKEAQDIANSLPSAGKAALSGIGEGVAIAGAAGTALASYTALLGPMSAYVSMGSALSATLPPLLLAGAAVGAVIGVINFKKEISNYHRVVAETVRKIRDSAKSAAMPSVLKAIDDACISVVDTVQEKLVGLEFEGLRPAEVEQIQGDLRQYCTRVETLRLG